MKLKEKRGCSAIVPVCFWVLAALLLIVRVIGEDEAWGEEVTVDRAVAIALDQNPDLLAARQEVDSAQTRVIKAHYLNQFNPQLEGGASQAQFEFAPGGSEPQPRGSLSLEIEVAGQRGKRINEADEALSKAKAEVTDAERLTRARAEYAFYQALYLRDRLRLAQQVEDLNRRLRDAAAVRFHSGESTKLDANLAAIRYDQSRKAALSANRDCVNGVRALQRVLGMQPAGPIELAGSLSERSAEVNPDRALQLAVANRPDLRARDYEMKRIAAGIALTRRLIVPNPIIIGFVERTADAPSQFIRVLGGSVGVAVPLFDRKQSELAGLYADQRRASYERTATELNIEQQVRDALSQYRAARAAVELFEDDAVGRVGESFGLIEGSYRSGKTGLLQLIVAENDLVAANSSYLDSLWDYWTARIGVEAAVGVTFDTLVNP